MVTYHAPTTEDLTLAQEVISNRIKWYFTNHVGEEAPQEQIYEECDLHLLRINTIQCRESKDVIECVLLSNGAFKLIQSCLNNDIVIDAPYIFEQNPFMKHFFWFNGDDLPDVKLILRTDDKALFYDHYIKSERWRLFRNKIFKERGFQCELCDNRKNLQLHHITYERFGEEHDLDVMILCQDCHKLAHS